MPVDFAGELPGHEVETVQSMGWEGVLNGELLRRAASRFDVFVTMDRHLPHQQHLTNHRLGLVLVLAPSNRLVTRRIVVLGLEVALHHLQDELQARPMAGVLDPGTGGLRKVRMPDPGRGKGKRGGARVHYLWLPHLQRIYLVFVYSKGDSDTLSADDKRMLKAVVQSIGVEP